MKHEGRHEGRPPRRVSTTRIVPPEEDRESAIAGPLDAGPVWLVKGLIPAGALVTFADLDDPPPETFLCSGADVVIRMHGRGAMDDAPVQVTVHWRPAFVPGHRPPRPFWIRFDGQEFVRAEVAA